MQTSHYISQKEEKKRKRRGFIWAFFFHVVLAILALYPFLVISEEIQQPAIEIQFQNYDFSETLAAGDDGGEAESNDAEEFSEEIEDPEGLESEDPVVEEVDPAPAEEVVEEVEAVEETVEEVLEETVEEVVEEVEAAEEVVEEAVEEVVKPEPIPETSKDILTADNDEAAIRAKKEKEEAEVKRKTEEAAKKKAETEAKKKAEAEAAKKKAETEAKKKAAAAAKKKAAAEAAKKKAAAAAAKKKAGAPGGTGSDSGTTKTEGSKDKKSSGGGGQGKKKTGPGKGTPGKGKADSGTGGSGGNADFGRKLMRSVKSKPGPSELKSLAGNATGRVVFNICINPDGRIIYTKYNSKLTTIKDKRIIKNVQSAMKRYRFKRDYKAPAKECGQFTFSFDRFD